MPLKLSSSEEESPNLNPVRHMVLSRILLSRNDMVTGSAHDTTSGGQHPRPAAPSGDGHPTSKQSSPVVPALVAVALIFLASILVWWIVSRLRRSWRGAPSTTVGGQESEKPILSDVELCLPTSGKPSSRWDELSPMSVKFASEDDKERWQYLAECSDDDGSSLSSSSYAQSRKPRPTMPFTLFSRASSRATTITPDKQPLELKVALMIAMPSQHGSQVSGDLCLGIAHPPVM
ncbi:hypothetical protein BV20DRAFT_94354 [Pilatotrama ljubarskyi]|nr:hypothetical protein BV20DRAFT_94354 [Pilatotrama ljubarskyi]